MKCGLLNWGLILTECCFLEFSKNSQQQHKKTGKEKLLNLNSFSFSIARYQNPKERFC
jgi:hypothetical protein